jgi:hypothetical protein
MPDDDLESALALVCDAVADGRLLDGSEAVGERLGCSGQHVRAALDDVLRPIILGGRRLYLASAVTRLDADRAARRASRRASRRLR